MLQRHWCVCEFKRVAKPRCVQFNGKKQTVMYYTRARIEVVIGMCVVSVPASFRFVLRAKLCRGTGVIIIGIFDQCLR